ncbi:MAG: RhuM family protein, partial [Patescibacteria group bacterium]
MKKSQLQKNLVIYQAKNGAIELRGDFSHENIWATQAQIATAFSVDVRTINEHIQNIFKTKELSENSTVRNFRVVQKEGKREVERLVKHYNLDMILSVGYRVNSKTATEFRKWATKTLKEHITKGYTINRKQIAKNYDSFMKSVGDIQALLPEHITLDPKTILELIKEFSSTWVSLDAYDTETLKLVGKTRKAIKLSGVELINEIQTLRSELLKKGEATEIFD